MGAAGPGVQHQQDHGEDDQGHDEEHQRVRFAGEHGEGERHGEEGHITDPVAAADDQDDGGEEPTRPRHHRGDGPSQPDEERPAQFEDRPGQGAGQHAESEDPAEDVCTGSGQAESHQYLDGVHEAEREEVAHQIGQAEDGRLPVKGQRHSQCVIGIPQGELTVVDLGPGQAGPGDHLVDLIAAEPVVDADTVPDQQPEAGQPVVLPEGQAVRQRRDHDADSGGEDPSDAEHVVHPGAREPPAAGRLRPRFCW